MINLEEILFKPLDESPPQPSDPILYCWCGGMHIPNVIWFDDSTGLFGFKNSRECPNGLQAALEDLGAIDATTKIYDSLHPEFIAHINKKPSVQR